jgi:uncharacterized protein (TIGR02391 family)
MSKPDWYVVPASVACVAALTVIALGMILLEMAQNERGIFTISNFEMPLWNANVPSYPIQKKRAVTLAIAEAWKWLQHEGLIVADPDQSGGWSCLTRKGAGLKSQTGIEAYRHGNVLPEGLMHPKLVGKVRPMFLRGDYDVAVIQAFKPVEVAVRKATKLPEDLVGQKLMRTAFNPENGKLADLESPQGERQAVMVLFSAAIGHGRNPPSHRDIDIERENAAQLIGFASHLLFLINRIVAPRNE